AVHHEINNRRRCVDDAVRVGNLDREALKELFINRIEKALFFRKVFDGAGGLVDGLIETVEALQESIASESLRSQRIDDLLDLGGDRVTPGEVGIVEDR